MSRVGKMPITVPKGAEITVKGTTVTVKGPLGSLTQLFSSSVVITQEGENLQVNPLDDSRAARANHGTVRAVLNNMVKGVVSGFEKKLTLVGVGYRAQAQGDKLNLSLGFSHPVVYEMPAGIKVETPTQNEIIIKGADRQKVGQVSAEIRAYRPPEPYKGKGVRYSDEVVIIKETKKK